MAVLLDIISPTTVGEDMIGVSIDASSYPLLVGNIITLQFDYSQCSPVGIVKPLKLQVQPAFGSGIGYFEELFDQFVPDSFAFQVQGAGDYLATIREVGHNQWQGRLVFTIQGDQYQDFRSSR